jgi:hypothetical protein
MHDSFHSYKFIITSNFSITVLSSMNYGAGGFVFRLSLYRIPYNISARLLLNESTSYSVANSALQNHP